MNLTSTNFFKPLLVAACILSASCLQAESNVELDPLGKKRASCEVDNAALQSMPVIQVTLSREDGSEYTVPAKLADNNANRAAGFQRVCASTIAAMPILFVFQQEQVPNFHMNNVVAPIDIAFIDKKGRIESIQSMKTYSMLQRKKPLYSPKRPVLYAFEAHPGFFDEHEISHTSKMTWTQPP